MYSFDDLGLGLFLDFFKDEASGSDVRRRNSALEFCAFFVTAKHSFLFSLGGGLIQVSPMCSL